MILFDDFGTTRLILSLSADVRAVIGDAAAVLLAPVYDAVYISCLSRETMALSASLCFLCCLPRATAGPSLWSPHCLCAIGMLATAGTETVLAKKRRGRQRGPGKKVEQRVGPLTTQGRRRS